jgi:hypothetical protein
VASSSVGSIASQRPAYPNREATNPSENFAKDSVRHQEESKELQETPEPKHEIRKPDAVLEDAKPKPAEKSKQQERAVTGGAAARGKAATEQKPRAPAAASAGSIREYAKSVSQALARTKPKGTLVRRASPKFVSPSASRDGSALFKL